MSEPIHPITPQLGEVTVRMYCTGLGDCFLLGFPNSDGETSFMLIDCGVLLGTTEAKKWMEKIMASIRDTVKNRGLEVLVATHKHWDHISGFDQAKTEFNKINVKHVWMGWTEDPRNETAQALVAQEQVAVKAIRAASTRLRGLNEKSADQLDALLAFDLGVDEHGHLGARSSSASIMEAITKRVDDVNYLKPSLESRHLKGVPGVNIYVLGPPEDLKFIKKLNPSKGEKSEVYLGLSNELHAFYSGVAPIPLDLSDHRDLLMRERSFPFDANVGIDEKDAFGRTSEYSEFYTQHYSNKSKPHKTWRQIGSAWLKQAESLAIKYDSYRNNTSLVLAFEVGDGGPVMLFAADAQVGNWLSWHTLEGTPSVTNLLKRTVLYKVGHHASHNATLKGKGLDLMGNTSELTAMISVDEKMARKPKGRSKKGWNMPYPDLISELQHRTQGRILRSDTGAEMLNKSPARGNIRNWKKFQKNTRIIKDEDYNKNLFVEYTVRSK